MRYLPAIRAAIPSELDWRHFLWFVLILPRPLFGPGTVGYDFLLAGVFMLYVVASIHRPKELLLLFCMAFFSNAFGWFTHFQLTGGSGSRILLLDVLLPGLFLLSAFYQLYYRKFNRFYLWAGVLMITLLWGRNFLGGILSSQIGYVIGEARFYFGVGLLFMVVNLMDGDPEREIRKYLHLICLGSFVISLHVLLIAVGLALSVEHDLAAEAASRRFNPGSAQSIAIAFGLIIACVDVVYKSDYHLIKRGKLILVVGYLMILVLSGVRTMTVISFLVLLYFFLISKDFGVFRKIMGTVAIVLLGAGALQLESIQKVVATQTAYVDSYENKSTGSTADWRMGMWEIFWKKISASNSRLLWGRPFDFERINIVELNWKPDGKIVPYADNSLAHNDFISMTMTNGLVFTACFLLILFLYLFRSYVDAQRFKSYRPLLMILFWFLLSQMIQSATNAEIKHYGQSITLWLHLGMLALMLRQLRRNPQSLSSESQPSTNHVYA